MDQASVAIVPRWFGGSSRILFDELEQRLMVSCLAAEPLLGVA